MNLEQLKTMYAEEIARLERARSEVAGAESAGKAAAACGDIAKSSEAMSRKAGAEAVAAVIQGKLAELAAAFPNAQRIAEAELAEALALAESEHAVALAAATESARVSLWRAWKCYGEPRDFLALLRAVGLNEIVTGVRNEKISMSESNAGEGLRSAALAIEALKAEAEEMLSLRAESYLGLPAKPRPPSLASKTFIRY